MTRFTDELQNITSLLNRLGLLVEDTVTDSIDSLIKRNSLMAREIINRDILINNLDATIEEECIALIALRQPVAGDLRFIITAMKITSSMERIGDLVVNICERVIELNEEPPLKPYIDIPKMAFVAKKMIYGSLKAFENRDKALAIEVIGQDDEIDNLMKLIYDELTLFMMKDSSSIPRASKITHIAKYLERIADHAVHMAKMVIYLVEGKIIRNTENIQ